MTSLQLDRFIGRLLFVEVQPTEADGQRAERAFGFSLVFSGIRCVLQYAILPFILPLIGLTTQLAVPITLGINFLAIGLIFYSLRRFWQIRYSYRWQYLGVATAALVILTVFIIQDLQHLFS
jgi:hypothetical protein